MYSVSCSCPQRHLLCQLSYVISVGTMWKLSHRLFVTHVVTLQEMVIFRILHRRDGRGAEEEPVLPPDRQAHNDRVRLTEQHATLWIFDVDVLLLLG